MYSGKIRDILLRTMASYSFAPCSLSILYSLALVSNSVEHLVCKLQREQEALDRALGLPQYVFFRGDDCS